MDKKELQDRTKKFAITILNLCNELPNTQSNKVFCGQLV